MSDRMMSKLVCVVWRKWAPSAMRAVTLGSLKAAAAPGRYCWQVARTAASISTRVTAVTEGCLRTSLRTPPSPPPMMRMVLGAGWEVRGMWAKDSE